MLNKKSLMIGISTLLLGVSMVGAAYALPMNTPMQSQNSVAPKTTVTTQQKGENTLMNNQQMLQYHEQMQQNHRSMNQNHHANDHAMHGSLGNHHSMGSGHMGFQNNK